MTANHMVQLEYARNRATVIHSITFIGEAQLSVQSGCKSEKNPYHLVLFPSAASWLRKKNLFATGFLLCTSTRQVDKFAFKQAYDTTVEFWLVLLFIVQYIMFNKLSGMADQVECVMNAVYCHSTIVNCHLYVIVMYKRID